MKNTLLLIFAALALMIGSFIWFVATWDSDVRQPVSQRPASSDQKQLPPEGPFAIHLAPAATTQPADFSNPHIYPPSHGLTDFAAKSAISDPYQTHTGPIPDPYGVS